MIQGTNADQDKRFSDKEKKLMKSMKFEDSLLKKVGFFPKKKQSRIFISLVISDIL